MPLLLKVAPSESLILTMTAVCTPLIVIPDVAIPGVRALLTTSRSHSYVHFLSVPLLAFISTWPSIWLVFQGPPEGPPTQEYLHQRGGFLRKGMSRVLLTTTVMFHIKDSGQLNSASKGEKTLH